MARDPPSLSLYSASSLSKQLQTPWHPFSQHQAKSLFHFIPKWHCNFHHEDFYHQPFHPCHGTLTHGCCIPPTSPRFPAPDTHGLSSETSPHPAGGHLSGTALKTFNSSGKRVSSFRGQVADHQTKRAGGGGACRSDCLSYVYVYIYIQYICIYTYHTERY